MADQPPKDLVFYSKCDLEHTLPQTPKGALPASYRDASDYDDQVDMLGNSMLIEGGINKALNKANDMSKDWISIKLKEYSKSSLSGAKMLDSAFRIGKNTAFNRFRDSLDLDFQTWDRDAIAKRQEVYFKLALNTWKLNGKLIASGDKRG